MIDVTDATFATDVIERSQTVPVVVDLWAPWCGPCRSLGPIIEKVVEATNGEVELVKINVDENPQASQAFQVQGIPAVYAMRDGQVVDGFVGAKGEAEVTEFVNKLRGPVVKSEVDQLVEAGDMASLQAALEIEADHEGASVALAQLFIAEGQNEEALEVLGRIAETAEVRRLTAEIRTGGAGDDVEGKLQGLLPLVKADDDARREFVDLLEVLGPDDPRTAVWRKKLTANLY